MSTGTDPLVSPFPSYVTLYVCDELDELDDDELDLDELEEDELELDELDDDELELDDVEELELADDELEFDDEELEEILNTERKPASFNVPEVVSCHTEVFQQKAMTQNVVAMLKGDDPVLKEEYIVWVLIMIIWDLGDQDQAPGPLIQ